MIIFMTEKNGGANQDIVHRIYFALFVDSADRPHGLTAFWDISARSAESHFLERDLWTEQFPVC